MANENGKAMGEEGTQASRLALDESEKRLPGLEKYFPPGPWTEKHEEAFQFVIREFGGGNAERDPDL